MLARPSSSFNGSVWSCRDLMLFFLARAFWLPLTTRTCNHSTERKNNNNHNNHNNNKIITYNNKVQRQKVPTFKFSVALSNLNRFSKYLHCWKAYEICYKSVQQYPPHLRHVATLPWEQKIQISGRLSTVTVPQLFQQLINTTHFSGNSPVNLFAVYPFKY